MNGKLIKLGVLLLALYGFVPLVLGQNMYVISMLTAAITIGGVALAWALLGNLGGMISFGHAAFFGVGAYTSAFLTMKVGVPVFPAMLLSGLMAVVVSVGMLPALKLKGPYFALAILAYAEIFRILATEFPGVTGGTAGLISIPALPTLLGVDFSTKVGAYMVIVTLVLAFVLVYSRIRISHYGIALRAMHESEDATRVVGVNSTLLKAMMLFVSAFMTGIVGAFNAHAINFLEPDYAFSGTWAILPVVAAIFGGYRTIWGPVFGALVVYLADQLVFKSFIPSGHQIVLGALLSLMIIASPAGLLPLLSRAWPWRARPPAKGDKHAEA
jgi:branched-chain amino acid transport system permease protein